MSLNSFSQTSDSVTCIPNSQLRIAARLIEQGKLDSAELGVQRTNVRLLYQRLGAKNDIIWQYQAKDSTYKLMVANYEADQKTMLDQVSLANRQVLKLQKDVKRQKTKTAIVGIAGIAATLISIFFISK